MEVVRLDDLMPGRGDYDQRRAMEEPTSCHTNRSAVTSDWTAVQAPSPLSGRQGIIPRTDCSQTGWKTHRWQQRNVSNSHSLQKGPSSAPSLGR